MCVCVCDDVTKAGSRILKMAGNFEARFFALLSGIVEFNYYIVAFYVLFVFLVLLLVDYFVSIFVG